MRLRSMSQLLEKDQQLDSLTQMAGDKEGRHQIQLTLLKSLELFSVIQGEVILCLIFDNDGFYSRKQMQTITQHPPADIKFQE